MKKLVFLSVALATVMLLSCGGGSRHQTEREEDTVDVNDLIRDHTVYGLCGGILSNSQLRVVTDNGDTLVLSITNAIEAGQVFGGLGVGDRIAVLPNATGSEAVIVINQNDLLGDWVMPNPIDGSSEVGIRIKEGGVAESIEQSSIIYKTWKIFNGRLEILSQRDGGGDEEELNLYELVKLGPDTLVYRTMNKPREEMETFEYSRWKEPEKLDLHGLQLEDAADEFHL